VYSSHPLFENVRLPRWVGNKSQGRHGFYSLAECPLLLMQMVNTHLITRPEQCEESEHVKPSEPNRLVPGGRDVEVQMRSLFIPDSVVIASYDSEMVLPGPSLV
jgi:flavoprotein